MESTKWIQVPNEVSGEVASFTWHVEDDVSEAEEHERARLVIKHADGDRCQYRGVPRSAVRILRDAVQRGDSVIFEHKLVAVRDLARERTWDTDNPPETSVI